MLTKSTFVLVVTLGVVVGSVTLHDLLKNGGRQVDMDLMSSSSVKADASEIVDQIMANVRAELIKNNLSSIVVPGTYYNASFSIKILGITFYGDFKLSDLHIDGLATIHRTGVADLTPEPNGDFVVTADVGLNDCGLGSGILVKFMGLGPNGSISGYLKNVQVLLQLRLNVLEGAAKLEKFDIKNVGTLSVDIKGLGVILNYVAEIVVNAFGNLVKGLVANLLEGVIKNIVNGIIENLPIFSKTRMVYYDNIPPISRHAPGPLAMSSRQ